MVTKRSALTLACEDSFTPIMWVIMFWLLPSAMISLWIPEDTSLIYFRFLRACSALLCGSVVWIW